ncbi:hypothetical protein WJX73_007953 [Symbiochloris irregularis]|uniref:Uncharacterized protein n=1 Tax=Symbiochloris irregularis TaxID=706552 RepID=A0AAW1P7T0_9CHLO
MMLRGRSLRPEPVFRPSLPTCSRPQRCRHCLRPVAVGWDPEGILAAPKGGHLSRRETAKEIESDKELQKQADRAREEGRQETLDKREARQRPATQEQLVEYLLNTEAEEMEYETVRCRPLITDEFFTHLGSEIGKQRFASRPDEGKVAELEGLRDFLATTVAQIDEKAKNMAAPKDRLLRLLQAQDKKAMLLQMAGDNEIDDVLLKLLQQNIDAARSAGQEQPAVFMEKIRDAARRYMLTV